MRCGTCSFDNPEGMRFCGQCGSPLAGVCPGCGFESPAGFQFCGRCGTALGEAEAAAPPAAAERRQLTVMFCDLVGSTELSQRLDPEELRDVLRKYQATCYVVISRLEGYVAQHLGDGLLVYFGYPQAHEDDARRAVRAGLEIIEAMAEARLGLDVRLGIHTGPVVAGEIGAGDKREQLAIGSTPNIASRVEGVAAPNTVAVSADTFQIVRDFFEWRPLGAKTLKGASRPMEVYLAVGDLDVEEHLEVVAASPPVGREREQALLLEHLIRSQGGHTQVVLLSGEAGIGKSRLVQVLREQSARHGSSFLICRCSPFYENTAFSPVIELLRRSAGMSATDSPETALEKLGLLLERCHLDLERHLPLHANLLGLPLGEGYEAPRSSPQRQRQELIASLVTLVRRLAAEQPMVLSIEDLHWSDPSTQELLGALMKEARDDATLILLTARPSFESPWQENPDLVEIVLDRFTEADAERLILRVTGGRALPPEVLRQVVEKTDGVPLFVEELTLMVIESGLLREVEGRFELAGPLAPLAIPTTLQDSLTARLDRLSTVKESAQLAATLGRRFSFEMFHALASRSESSLEHDLGKLVEAQLLTQEGRPPKATYTFRHALIQDAAYNMLLKSTRQQCHARIAQILVERFPESVAAEPEVVARHYTEADLLEPAVDYWRRAGEQANRKSAHLEAIAHLRKGLTLLERLPESSERDLAELSLQMSLGTALIATRGYATPEVARAYGRAQELCERTGEPAEHFWVLLGLTLFHLVRADLEETLRLSHRLVELADSRQDSTLLSAAFYQLGATHFFMGELDAALENLDKSLELVTPEDRAQRDRFGHDVQVMSLAIGALVLWLLGHPDRSLERGRKALALAREIDHPHTLAMALVFAGSELHQFRRESDLTRQLARELLDLSRKQGFLLWDIQGQLFSGWAEQAETQEAGESMQAAFAGLMMTGGRLAVPYFRSLLAAARCREGRIQEAREDVEKAITMVEETGDRFWAAELYRLRGELILLAGDSEGETVAGAERAFAKACEVARLQGAKALELRATLSLSRLHRKQGETAVARETLAGVYEGFEEGFGTPDLEDCRSFLEVSS